MANASSSNGEPTKKETRVNFEHGSGVDSDMVEVTIHQPSKTHKKKKHGYHFLPKPFERSNGSLLNPKFDSEILESYLIKCYFPQARRLFRNILYYVAIASICWAIFFGLMQIEYPSSHWYYFVGGSVVLLLIMVGLFFVTHSKQFEKHSKIIAIFLAVILVVAIQLPFTVEDHDISPVGTFFGVVEILILLYSFFPLNLFAAAGLGGFLSISYEVFTALRFPQMQNTKFIICKILLHFILHLIGFFIHIMSNSRARSNFSKIGQSVSAQRDLMVEREIKEKMIHSLMPPTVAKSVMATHPSKDEEEAAAAKKPGRKSAQVRGEIIFRRFQMDEMSNVSILFADIVGFTKMSSNKTAERLVGLLNDLFGRFDKLCNASECEKISTLGDCYYCVSGCPNPQPGHAKNCVEMGLSMVIAIRAFDEDHKEEVNMRVGVHTGTVLCGIVGTVRFKFDVWSNDVTLANTMESTGEPGKVHISESTREFLVDEYEMVEGEEVPDMRGRKELIEHYDPAQSSFTIKHREETRNIKTYFITGRKPGKTGIPGLEELADERPEHLQKEKQLNKEPAESPNSSTENKLESKNVPNDVENGNSAAAADLFSQRIPDIMSADEEGENQEKTADDLETNLSENQPQRVSKYTDKNSNCQDGKGDNRQCHSVSPPCNDLDPHMAKTSKAPVTLTSYKHCNSCTTTGLQGGGNGVRTQCKESGADSTLLKKNRSESVTDEQDKLLVSLIEKENQNENTEAFFKPALNKLCLTFKPGIEQLYRHEYKDSHLFQENMLSSPRYQTTVEAAIALIALVVLAICCHIMFDFARTTGLIVMTLLGLTVQILVFIDALTNIICLETKKKKFPTLMNITLSWYFRNALGVIMATIPAALVYLSLSCDLVTSDGWHDRFFCFAIVVALLQYCNYNMLRSFAKSIMAILVGSVLIVLLFFHLCTSQWNKRVNSTMSALNISSIAYVPGSMNLTTTQATVSYAPIPDHLFSGENLLRFEIILSTLLLLVLITILNYEFENSYRLSFNASIKAQKDKENMQLNKDQADWLLHNIIPAHLAELFKNNRSYSRNHQDVGVIFATIVNFNEFYDEMYAGGREYLRVLNELVSDYEVMLSETRFKDVEKIKTISSSFMAAAGLNEESRAQNKHPYAHLFALMEFATELLVVIDRFNESIFNFSFTLNIGYNYGPVTAGVIGTTKLLYDIWGDTVNIASRMYSTGEANKVQVPQATAELLGEMFEFSYRDEIFVKGKGMMKTYLEERKKPGAHWE